MTDQEKDGSGVSTNVYLIDSSKSYKLTSPSPMDNLLSLYNLEDVARSLSRIQPDGSKGVKLRKSYKNHIQDLPGKHQIMPPKPLPMGLLDPNIAKAPDIIKEIDPGVIKKALKFDKSPINGLSGFNIGDLAINDQQMLMRGDDISENDEQASGKKRRKKNANNGNSKRQHI